VRDGHKRFAGTVAAVCVTALGGSMLAATPTYANPSIKDVKARVDSLYHQAEKASERYNAARGDLHAAKVRLHALQGDLSRQAAKVAGIRKQVASAVVAQYQGSAFSSTTQVLLSRDPNTFLDQLTTVSEYNDQQSQMMADFAAQVKQLQMRKQASKRQLVQISATEKKLAADKCAGLGPRCLGRAVRDGPGRRGLRLRCGRPERVGLLRPHDDGLGCRRRQPPALGERPDGLRHPGLVVAAPAR
jgi:hypothetical protein